MTGFNSRRKRGFSTTIAAALAALAIAIAVSATLAFSSIQHAGIVSLEVRKAFEGFEDAKPFFDSTVNDALLDSAFQKCGCSSNNASGLNTTIHTLVRQYLGNSSNWLTYGPVTINYSSLSIPSLSPSSCNTTLSGTFSYTLTVNSSNANATTVISSSKALGIQKNNSVVWVNLTNSSVLAVNVTVTCA